jgi:hypothetical protein
MLRMQDQIGSINSELPAFMTRLREQKGIAARALEFTILTAARTGEIIGTAGPK